MKNSYLDPLLQEFDGISHQVRHHFSPLSKQQLNWKPKPDRWSIAQCLDHLIQSNKAYFPTLVQISDGTKREKKREKLPILPDVWGKWLVRSSRPNSRLNILKAPEAYLPTPEPKEPTIIEEFLDNHTILLEMIRKTDYVDHDSTIITSPRNSLITFSLRDCIKIILHHEIGHINQAKAIIQELTFPVVA